MTLTTQTSTESSSPPAITSADPTKKSDNQGKADNATPDRPQLTWIDAYGSDNKPPPSGVVSSAPPLRATSTRGTPDPRFSTDGNVIALNRSASSARFTQADAEKAIAQKIDPRLGNMDPVLAQQIDSMHASPVWKGATPPGSPNGPVWFQSYTMDPHGDPGNPDAQVYAYQRGNALAVFEVAGGFAKAYASIDPGRAGTNSGLGLPVSGREVVQPGTPLGDKLSQYYQGPGPHYFQNFENGMLLETKKGGPGANSEFAWVDKQGNLVKGGFEVPFVDLSKVQSPVPTTNSELRPYWSNWVRENVAPRLKDLGVSADKIDRVINWGKSEGIYTIANNPEYGQADGSAQSPLTFTNFFDSNRHPEWTGGVNVNGLTSDPNPWDYVSKVKSGDWQVGIAGIQVSDAINSGSMKKAYGMLYADQKPQDVGQRMLDLMGESGARFPDLSIDDLAKKENWKWAAVLLHDPTMNVLIQTWNPHLP